MKHLAMNQELKNQMNQYMMDSSGDISSPKVVNLNHILSQNSRIMIGQIETQQLQFTPATLNRNYVLGQQNVQQQVYYEKGLQQRSSQKQGGLNHNNSVSSNNSNSSSKRGSLTPAA